MGAACLCLLDASEDYREFPPLGSHPLLDHLWSTESREFVRDGVEATRAANVMQSVGRCPVALANLTVCWSSEPGRHCRRCW